ncbi:aldehyde dehydrogenase family protein [Halpernia frigidisoli]|uniref:Succinate-semialdehyde dehydrogenase / glutarate-semialdehyde dehydrogenase n=1 Tax=Halpernia frigidisoli TaxID=1125876 RepID=A0A1I3GDI5_9FLAO|nr:aldehyde dehydrogenase family protein [Halpernia frigidisoli]SFI21568.1 succinate-semialdehyde dehydrogenase / glutarate-semialdehyde dehydrogenase [Halpernia frigidisoli]
MNLDKSQKTFESWRTTLFTERQDLLHKLSEILLKKKEIFGEIMTKEMNKPISQSISEIEKCAAMAQFYANAENVLAPEKIESEFDYSEIHHEPMGIILGVMPWNYPFWQVLRFAVPAILAGNVVIMKHAAICLKSGDALQEAFEEAGFPENVFKHIKVSHDEIETILENPFVQGVSLTGSEKAGSTVAAIAGKNIKKSLLELGGNDAFIVLDDSDLDKAAKSAALGRLQNCGQTCVASKRFIIQSSVYDEFLEKFIAEFKTYFVADPMDKETKIAGMAREDLTEDLEKQYNKAIENGAEIILPLERIDKISFKPGLLKMNPGNPVLDEELFGPLGMVVEAKTDKELLEIANNTKFGLANSVWSKDKKRLEFFFNGLESGTVSINQITKSDARFPFGGTKSSGYGIELSLNALKEFTNTKMVLGKI